MRCIDDFNRITQCQDAADWTPIISIAAGSLLAVVALVILWRLALYPRWNVWRSRKEGEADLAEANFEQQIQIATASARKAAASLNKEAAIIEAEAVAAQITCIGEHLKQHDLYLRWQWIEMMKHRDGETIYVPTEANLPILEATRRSIPTVQTKT